jgi:hypothetical protein
MNAEFNFDFDFAKVSQINDSGLIVRGQLPGNLELIGFGGTTRADEHNELPLVYTEGIEGVPTFNQMRLPTQDWTHWTWHDTTAGAILRTTTTGAWSLAAGIFRSIRDNPPNYDDLFLDVTPDRTVSHQIDVVPPLDARSTSGEFRLAYRTTSGARTQVWTMTVRGRDVSRTFGGDSITDLGRVSIDDYRPLVEPPVIFPPPEPVVTVVPIGTLPPPIPIGTGGTVVLPPFPDTLPPSLPPEPGSSCPPPTIVINPPVCPAPIPGPPGPAGPPGPGGVIYLAPGDEPPLGYPSSLFAPTIVLPDNIINIDVPPSPPPDINIQIDVHPDDAALIAKIRAAVADPVPPPPPRNPWNQLACPKLPVIPGLNSSSEIYAYFERMTGFKQIKLTGKEPLYSWPKGWAGLQPGDELTPIGQAAWWATYAFEVGLPAAALSILPNVSGCETGALLGPFAKKLVLEFLQKWIGVNLENLIQPVQYEINAICPSAIPGQSAIDAMRNANWIDEDTWLCWTRANNNLDVPAKTVREASRPQLRPEDAFKVEKLDPDTFDGYYLKFLERAGIPGDQYGAISKLMEFIPSAADLVRFMTRDVFDSTVFEPFQLDDEFDKKFQGDIVKWSEAQGMNSDKLKLYWRAHWQWPSPSQMYQMLHRWRPKGVDLPEGVLPVTITDVERVLGITDVAPVWRKRLTYLSYKVINRLELRRLFANGLIDKKQFISGMLDLGYEPRAADKIASLFEELNRQQRERESRTLSLNWISSHYADGSIDRTTAFNKLVAIGITGDNTNRVIDDAQLKAAATTRQNRIGNYKRRFTRGEFDKGTAVGLLQQAGVDTDQAIVIVSGWDQTIKDRGKHASAAMLCKWLGQGLLTGEEYYKRLTNLGWTNEDAARIVASCGLDLAAKAAKTSAAAAKKSTARKGKGK